MILTGAERPARRWGRRLDERRTRTIHAGFWAFQAIETAIFIALAVGLLFGTIYLRRRRIAWPPPRWTTKDTALSCGAALVGRTGVPRRRESADYLDAGALDLHFERQGGARPDEPTRTVVTHRR